MSTLGRLGADRRVHLLVVGASIAIIVVFTAGFAVGTLRSDTNIPIGLDWIGYRRGWERLLETGTPYQAFQLDGMYTPRNLDFIHPPSFLPLVAPFTVLPSPFDYLAWMAVPTAITVYLLRRMAWWAWPIVTILAITPNTIITYINGNSSMWFAAAFGWSLYVGWPAGLIAMKASLGPLAVPGFLRDPRRTLVLVAIPILLTIPFLATWADWVTILRNAQGIGVFYSLVQWTVFTIVALPWLTTRGLEHARAGRARLRQAPEATVVPDGRDTVG
jgi:hypothetical protein